MAYSSTKEENSRSGWEINAVTLSVYKAGSRCELENGILSRRLMTPKQGQFVCIKSLFVNGREMMLRRLVSVLHQFILSQAMRLTF